MSWLQYGPVDDEDFCLWHGRDHMVRDCGNPIAYCKACAEHWPEDEPLADDLAPIPGDLSPTPKR